MEIEDLKDIWKKQSEGFKPKDETELTSMLRGRSTSIIARLKRNIWFELIGTFFGVVGLLIYALTLPAGYLKWTSIAILGFFCLFTFYYFKKLRLLNRFDPGKDNLKTSLQKLIPDLKGYLKFYKRSYSFLYPVFFFLGMLFTGLEYGAEGFLQKVTRPEVFMILLPGAVLFFICSNWLTGWYLKKLYGNHLEKLESLLKELQG
jgi:hypothetical protein